MQATAATPRRELSLVDSTSLIVGIIIGVGIYQTAPEVARGAGSIPGTLLLWAFGGLVSLCGALAYAELATAYPRQGGDYVYLTRAYGRPFGFLFAWMQLVVVRPGDIAVMAFAFAKYAQAAMGGGSPPREKLMAAAAIVVVTAINVLGVRQGKWTQNLLTFAKAAGLLLIFAVGLLAPPAAPTAAAVDPFPWSVALILVLFTYGGWNEMAYVAAEVRDPNRNITRALVLGTVGVTALYLLANAAFFSALGYGGVAASSAVAADTVAAVVPRHAPQVISLLICISALGAVNGLVFTGARISYAAGQDHRLFGWMGHWEARRSTPVRALLVQGALAVGLVVALGGLVEAILYTAPAVYTFYLATTVAVAVLRRKEPQTARPYRMWAYPAPAILFGVVCAWLVYRAIIYKPLIAVGAVVLCLLGVPAYLLSQRLARRAG
ncbi:MAG: amino acid permease [Verrucomicrobia bacterium]|nr:MAG: amino acid permease [Verrucomicrobiota bacterium]